MADEKYNSLLWVGIGVFALILILIAVIMYLSGQDPTVVGGAAAAAAATAEVARRKRAETQKQITEAFDFSKKTSQDLETLDEQVSTEVTAVVAEVEDMDRDEKEKLGEQLFGGGTFCWPYLLHFCSLWARPSQMMTLGRSQRGLQWLLPPDRAGW